MSQTWRQLEPGKQVTGLKNDILIFCCETPAASTLTADVKISNCTASFYSQDSVLFVSRSYPTGHEENCIKMYNKVSFSELSCCCYFQYWNRSTVSSNTETSVMLFLPPALQLGPRGDVYSPQTYILTSLDQLNMLKLCLVIRHKFNVQTRKKIRELRYPLVMRDKNIIGKLFGTPVQ